MIMHLGSKDDWKKNKFENGRKTGLRSRARARRGDISGNIAPIDLKFLGMLKTPNLSLLAKI